MESFEFFENWSEMPIFGQPSILSTFDESQMTHEWLCHLVCRLQTVAISVGFKIYAGLYG